MAAGPHLVACLVAGAASGIVATPSLGAETAGLLGWVVAATAFLVWTWASIWSLTAVDTAWFAAREDPSRPARDLVMLVVSIGTLVTVVVVIFRAHENPPERTALAVAALTVSWLVVTTIFTLRYARLYYGEPRGGVDFNQDDDPTFRDFAYLAFTIGMTYQVSDTTLAKTEIRATVLRQGLTSFVYNTVIIAVTVNIIAGLSH